MCDVQLYLFYHLMFCTLRTTSAQSSFDHFLYFRKDADMLAIISVWNILDWLTASQERNKYWFGDEMFLQWWMNSGGLLNHQVLSGSPQISLTKSWQAHPLISIFFFFYTVYDRLPGINTLAATITVLSPKCMAWVKVQKHVSCHILPHADDVVCLWTPLFY